MTSMHARSALLALALVIATTGNVSASSSDLSQLVPSKAQIGTDFALIPPTGAMSSKAVADELSGGHVSTLYAHRWLAGYEVEYEKLHASVGSVSVEILKFFGQDGAKWALCRYVTSNCLDGSGDGGGAGAIASAPIGDYGFVWSIKAAFGTGTAVAFRERGYAVDVWVEPKNRTRAIALGKAIATRISQRK
jgi:hypothetical protein